jgi:cbb3-type cytochrome oxidase maturation protein
MSAIYLLIPISLVVALAFLAAFIWAVRSGQYEDTCTPALRVLTEDAVAARSLSPSPKPEPRSTHES